MPKSRRLRIVIGLAISTALSLLQFFTTPQAQQPASDVAIDNDDIGGGNRPKGPEAVGDRGNARPPRPIHQMRRD